MEFCSRGTLESNLREREKNKLLLQRKTKITLENEIAKGMSHLADARVKIFAAWLGLGLGLGRGLQLGQELGQGLELGLGLGLFLFKQISMYTSHPLYISSVLFVFKIVHRNLASKNILLTEDFTPKISNFGLSHDIYERRSYQKLAQVSKISLTTSN